MFGRRQASNAITVIAGGSVVVGTLRVRGMVQVDGTIEGSLLAEGHVSVGPEGRVIGDVVADDLSIGGNVEGSLHARGHLHVLPSGCVRGEVRYTTLEVDRGGVMDGRASRVPGEPAPAKGAPLEMMENAAAE
jgi:cytoskeletal protein CcmA (bactofilin family)